MDSEPGLLYPWSENVDYYFMWTYLGTSMSGHCRGLTPTGAITKGCCGRSSLQDIYPTACSKGTGTGQSGGQWFLGNTVITGQPQGWDQNHFMDRNQAGSTGPMTRVMTRYVVITEFIWGLSMKDLKAWPNPK